MTKRILIAVFSGCLFCSSLLGAGVTIKEDFKDATPKISNWQGKWELKDGSIKTKTGQNTYSAFKIQNMAINQTTISFKVKQLKLNPKGSLFGIKVLAKDKSQLHLFYQGQLMRCIQTVNGQKSKTENFGKLPEKLPAGEKVPWTKVTFAISANQIKSMVDKKNIGTLPLKDGWTASLPITEIEFHAFQADISIDDIEIKTDGSKPKFKAQPGDTIKSQLDVVEEIKVEKGPNDFRILYIGDSITRHGFSKNTIRKLGWGHVAGMAATKEENDYAHLVAAEIQKQLSNKKVHVYFHSKGGSGAAAHRLSAIDEFAQVAPQVVVVQLGEHEKEPAGVEALKSNYKKLLQKIQAWTNKPLIICTGVWNPYGTGKRKAYTTWSRKVEDTMKGVCNELNIPFASVEKYALDPECSGWGTSHGVKWHPNDKGMQGYADAIYAKFKENYKEKKK